MKAFLRSQNLWKITEEGVRKEGLKAKVLENEKDDAKVLFLLQQAIGETIQLKILKFDTTK